MEIEAPFGVPYLSPERRPIELEIRGGVRTTHRSSHSYYPMTSLFWTKVPLAPIYCGQKSEQPLHKRYNNDLNEQDGWVLTKN